MNEYKLPDLYTSLAGWFHLLTNAEDYAEEASIFTTIIQEFVPSAWKVLELGSGGGNNAYHMKHTFNLTLTDLSTDMLAISRTINPELPHHQGDMRTVRLEPGFDAVFIHDAVTYLTQADDLGMAFETAFYHLRPGGMVLVVPDCVKETFHESTEWGGNNSGEGTLAQYAGKALRYLEWSYDPDPTDTTYITEFAYLLREGSDQVRCVYDRHICGLFPRETWLQQLSKAGFETFTRPFDHSEVEPGVTELFIGVKPDR